jgi:hypothetical protein
VLRQVEEETSVAAPFPGSERLIFERLGLLVNQRGDVQLEDESEASVIQRDALVKIV